MPYAVNNISAYAFKDCNFLKEIYIPFAVSTISEQAFNTSDIIFHCHEDSYAKIYADKYEYKTGEGIHLLENEFSISDSLKVGCGETEDLKINVSNIHFTDPIICNMQENEFAEINDNNSTNIYITGKAVGESEFTVSISGIQYTVKVFVDNHIKEINLENNVLNLTDTNTVKLNYTVLPENASERKIIWKSDNEDVVVVDDDGNVTAVANGSASVIALSEDGKCYDACIVNVNIYVPVQSVILNYSEFVIEKESYIQLQAICIPENASNQYIYWSSSNTSVAVVANGWVMPLSDGYAIITATAADGGCLAECRIVVNRNKEYPSELVINTEQLNFNEIGQEEKLTTYFMPDESAGEDLVWSSSDESVAKVDNDGNVTAIGYGSCTITAMTEDKFYIADCIVNVVKKENQTNSEGSQDNNSAMSNENAQKNNSDSQQNNQSDSVVTVANNNSNLDKYTNDDNIIQNSTTGKQFKINTKFIYQGLKYKIIKVNGKYCVSVIGYMRKSKSVKIPKYVIYEGKRLNVIKIGKSAFKNNKTIKKCTIESNIIYIDNKAFFGCSNLKKVTIKSKKIKVVKKNVFKKTDKNIVFSVPKSKRAKYVKYLGKNVNVK